MPIWVSPDLYGMFSIGTNRAALAGLTCRPTSETVFDSWAWLQSGGQTEISGSKFDLYLITRDSKFVKPKPMIKISAMK